MLRKLIAFLFATNYEFLIIFSTGKLLNWETAELRVDVSIPPRGNRETADEHKTQHYGYLLDISRSIQSKHEWMKSHKHKSFLVHSIRSAS